MLPHSTVPSDLIEFKVPRIHSRRILRLPHKDISFLLRVRAFVVYPLSAGRSVTNSTPRCTDQSFNRREKEQNAHLIDGLHVSRPQPLNTFLAVALFFFFPDCTRIVPRTPPASKYPKVICCLMSAALCTINSLQQCPETPFCP